MGHKVTRVVLEDLVVAVEVKQVMVQVVPQPRDKVSRVVLVQTRVILVVRVVVVQVPWVVMVVTGLVVMVVPVNFSGRRVRLPISGTSMVKVDTSRVVRVEERVVVTMLVYLVEVVVDTVRVTTGTWVEVGRNTVWYTRAVVVVVVEHRIETNTQGMRVVVMVVLRLTADAVVRG